MDDRDQRARWRAEEVSDELAIRKEERRMSHEERRLEREGKEVDDTEERAEKEIEEELRREHWGHEPEPPPDWPKHEK